MSTAVKGVKRALMLCTFCGTENRPEYNFVALAVSAWKGGKWSEGRTRPAAQMRGMRPCAEPGMKFCGMCGTRIERRMEDRRGIQ